MKISIIGYFINHILVFSGPGLSQQSVAFNYIFLQALCSCCCFWKTVNKLSVSYFLLLPRIKSLLFSIWGRKGSQRCDSRYLFFFVLFFFFTLSWRQQENPTCQTVSCLCCIRFSCKTSHFFHIFWLKMSMQSLNFLSWSSCCLRDCSVSVSAADMPLSLLSLSVI